MNLEQIADPGYSIEPSVLSNSDCDRLIESLCEAKRGRAGVRHLMSNPCVEALASDHRLLAIARRTLGQSAIPFRATLFEKSGQANWLIAWHQDTALPLASFFDAPGGPWSRKAGVLCAHAPTWALSRILALRVHLDASTSQNGPLRVIPGSHAGGVLTDDDVLNYAKARDGIECLIPRGGVLTMRPLLIHASSKARVEDPRRVLHIEYSDAVELAPGIRLAVA